MLFEKAAEICGAVKAERTCRFRYGNVGSRQHCFCTAQKQTIAVFQGRKAKVRVKEIVKLCRAEKAERGEVTAVYALGEMLVDIPHGGGELFHSRW